MEQSSRVSFFWILGERGLDALFCLAIMAPTAQNALTSVTLTCGHTVIADELNNVIGEWQHTPVAVRGKREPCEAPHDHPNRSEPYEPFWSECRLELSEGGTNDAVVGAGKRRISLCSHQPITRLYFPLLILS